MSESRYYHTFIRNCCVTTTNVMTGCDLCVTFVLLQVILTRLPVKASVNSFLCLEYEMVLIFCGCSANCNAEEGQETETIEKTVYL